ncbi:hypothetical protein B0T10DRAFT_555918 [Thelonectria olida]|uniref:Uncharacterized protein n=1 Tax=Thelonectria olida TaxID=1576542 RepID=A0A9P8WFN9_9HYPO|nr:hypothetical protein B0T10DRAFT_555918 [Thelonectria olida]
MPANDNSASSGSEDADPSVVAIECQKRIAKLKSDRVNRMNAVVQECNGALSDVRSRVIANQEERRNKESQVYAASVKKLLDAIERRKEMEAKMEDLVKKLHSTTQELEEMMLKAYGGREDDLKKHAA